jgi:hypothetical protein
MPIGRALAIARAYGWNYVFRLSPILTAAALWPGLCPLDKGYAYRQGFGYRQGSKNEFCISTGANIYFGQSCYKARTQVAK